MKLPGISYSLWPLCAAIAWLAAWGCNASGLRDDLGAAPTAVEDGGVLSGPCPAGMFGATEDDCQPCDVGSYCEAGSIEEVPCVDRTWDHDADPRTRCEVWTNCPAGHYIEEDGSPIHDRRCVPCPEGRFSVEPNAEECMPWNDCEPGTYIHVDGTQGSGRVCSPCPAGKFSGENNLTECVAWSACSIGEQIAVDGRPGGDRECERCPGGTFSTSENSPSCQNHRSCEPGTFVGTPGTRTEDAACSGCESGKYTSGADSENCTDWSDCQPGQFVSELGTAIQDRVCEPCPPDTESFSINSGACVAVGDCQPGTVVITPATEDTPAECEDCEAGQYCAGGNAEAIDCGNGDWDDDADPATPCVAQTMCSPGEFILDGGNATSDRSCDTCPAGSFSTQAQSESCTSWQHCQPGSFIDTAGSSVTDRGCADCPNGTFTSEEDQTACVMWSVCTAPNAYAITAPSASNDRECGLCEAPEVTLQDNASDCTIPRFVMTNGRAVMEAESYHVQEQNGSNHAWERIDAPLASGDEALAVNPDVQYQWPDNGIAEFSPRLDFRVNFTTTGTFYIHLRGDPGASGAGSDTCYAGIDGTVGPMYDFDDAQASWSWRQQGFSVDTEGQHTISIWAREDGFRLDKIVVSTDSNSPTGDGPSESDQE